MSQRAEHNNEKLTEAAVCTFGPSPVLFHPTAKRGAFGTCYLNRTPALPCFISLILSYAWIAGLFVNFILKSFYFAVCFTFILSTTQDTMSPIDHIFHYSYPFFLAIQDT